ncbi:hypothetical protein SAMN04487934_11229 [Eubacterium ruminantium]|nr:hypothetical protein SAMN04487934_11229 [Eubacterium ruminantium]
MNSLISNCMKLGFGLMRLPRLDSGEIDVEQTKQMVDDFFDAGGRYFDTAFVYGGSEEATKKALVERYPRDSYYLATKLNASSFACKNEEEAKNEFNISLERLGTDYIDFYLLHALDKNNKDTYEKYGLWDYVKKLKAEGKIKHYGFSFHDQPEVLDEILTAHPEAEFVQLQINYADWDDANVNSRKCYEVAVKHNKPVVVMEPVKGGTLANPPERVMEVFKEADPMASAASWAVKFAASLPQVMVVLSGMSNVEQMKDNISYMKDFEAFSEDEQKVIEKATAVLKETDSIPCTACHYCTPGCPMKLHIPEIFACMNEYKIYGNLERAKNGYAWRPGGTKASQCVKCRKCEGACPQHLPIVELLQEVADTLE